MPTKPSKNLVAVGLLLLAATCSAGCRTADGGGRSAQLSVPTGVSAVSATTQPNPAAAEATANGVVPAAYRVAENGSAPTDAASPPSPPTEVGNRCDDDPFLGRIELDPEALVAAVRERNPSLAAMSAAWQAAVERYPQAIALEDPQLSTAMGPGTFGDPNHDVAWMIEGSQKFPWPGKRICAGSKPKPKRRRLGSIWTMPNSASWRRLARRCGTIISPAAKKN